MTEAVGSDQIIAKGIAENTDPTAQSFFEMLGALLGELAGQLQSEMVEKGKEMQEAQEGSGEDGEFAKAQSEFQAAQQEYTMFMEVVSTILKNLGQSAQTLARNQ